MIERAVGCLEKRGIRSSYAEHGIPLRSYRRLHSAFWSHGAGSIDLPSWWIALLQLPQTKEASEAAQEDTKPRFLDFLYPSQALVFIQKNISADSAIVRRHRQIVIAHQRSRAYASLTPDALLDPSDRATPLDAKEHTRQPADDDIHRDMTRAEHLKTQLDDFLLIDDGEADLSELWKVYLEIQNLALTLHPRQILRLLRCLTNSRSKVNQERSLQIFGSLPVTERKSIHYSYAISAALNTDKIEAATRLHSEASLGINVSIGTSSLLSYTVERRLWQVAVETWQAYWNHKVRNVESSDIWADVDTIPLIELWDCTLSALDFAAKLTELADTGAAASARGFALQLALRSFALRDTQDDSIHNITIIYGLKQVGTFYQVRRGNTEFKQSHFKPDSQIGVEHVNVEKQRQLFDKATSLQAPTYELYESATRQALSFSTKPYVTQALKFYQALRANAHITPTPNLLEALLRQVCEIKSQAGILLILDDYRHYHGTLTRDIYQLAIRGLAKQGHLRVVETLLEEYHLHYGKITSSSVANSILEAHKNRAEVKPVVETFKSLEDRYGFKPDRHSFEIVIATHARVGDVEGASTWYNSLLDSGLKPSSGGLVRLMTMFAKRGDVEVVKRLLRQSEAFGFETNIAMINRLVLAYVTNRQLADAEKLVHEVLQTTEKVSQKSYAWMWNCLLNAFAMRGNLEKVTDLHRKMRANDIPSDAVTFAALMNGFSIMKQPKLAHRILTDVMPQLGIMATSHHYSICMGGYLRTNLYHKVFSLYSEMLEKGIQADTGVHNILIRAAACIDAGGSLRSTIGSDQQIYELARRTFEQAMEDLDPAVLATSNHFTGVNRLDESFTSSYFSYLIFIHGKQRATDQVKDLYDRYIKVKLDLNMDVESILPYQMLSALMAADLKIGNHDAVDNFWDLSLKSARKLAHRAGTKYSNPGWVLPARRFILNVHLRHYMQSLLARSKDDEISNVIKHLHSCGYELDSKTWNFYIKALLRNNKVLLAFEYCEKELMPGWAAREPRMNAAIRRHLRTRQPTMLELDQGIRMPDYQTLVNLTAAFVESQSLIGAEGGIPATQRLSEVAPKTVDVVSRLPRIKDRLQRKLLGPPR
ncbi:MAG: hypothetical protein HETSPECPRED_000505 [Heterodermia speciosa]|uniref:Pentacotripeptide-repeat region of PRORP domain-containing protein n=1 Tax=Heterodermia speciosa TaxID=116794 RepID=A0A8H3G5X1_9LECA|nr:MAG: hypothetical protein HETSPECPRED_000505 [Heterodermia speciosa]